MAKGHSYLWRRPGRRDEERKQFAALMGKVEVVRVRYGMTKTELAAELGANVDGVRAWMTGRTVGRKESVDKIKTFLTRKKTAQASDIARVMSSTEKSLRSRPSLLAASAMIRGMLSPTAIGSFAGRPLSAPKSNLV